MMARRRFKVFCLPWHLTFSPSMKEVLAEVAGDEIEWNWAGWDGKTKSFAVRPENLREYAGVLFFQMLPRRELLESLHTNVTWMPMWDEFRHRSALTLARLAERTKVVSFARIITERFARMPQRLRAVQYYRDPAAWPAADWQQPRTVFCWNREGLHGPEFIGAFIEACGIERVVFQAMPDPGAETNKAFRLPAQFHGAAVTTLDRSLPRADYLRVAQSSQFYLAPRQHEGIGLSFLEALARGACVCGLNSATLNEYVTHGRTGVLLDRACQYRAGKPSAPIGEWRGWFDQLRQADQAGIGAAARQAHADGYRRWQVDRERLRAFLLEP